MARSSTSRAPSILTALSCLLSLAYGVTNQTAAFAACSYLGNTLGPAVILPMDDRYQSASRENWVRTAWASPACVILPTTAGQVSRVVKHCAAHGVQFAIRSGGHSPAPLAANINDGVLIDMSGFDSVEYHAKRGVAVVGAGTRWGNVYRHLDPYNVTVVGGRVLQVGVGGLVLGCGLSYLSDLYGLACDNVENFEVVLADGSVINANQYSHASLWWALKGGANNFGIVTRFTLTTYPAGDVWGGFRVYALDVLPRLFGALLRYQTVAVKDPCANLMMQVFPLNGTLGVLLNMVYTKPVATPAVFTPFLDIPAIAETVRIQPMTDLLAALIPPSLPRLNWYTTSFQTDATLFEIVQRIIATSPEVNAIRNLTAGSIAVGWQPISTSVIHAGHARGGNALGLEYVNQTWLVVDVGWWRAEDDAVANEATARLVAKIEDAAKSRGKHVDYIFMNDAAVSQGVIRHYGIQSVARLRATQRRYDPLEVFQKLVPGGFKLPPEVKTDDDRQGGGGWLAVE